MRKIIYLLLICPLLAVSQSFTIEYDVALNVLNRKGVLTINNTISSFYFEVQNKRISDEQKMDEEGTYNQTVYLGSNKERKRFQIYKKEIDTLLNVDYLKDEQIICSELFPKMIWKLEDETKTISNYLCNKASTNFRGRNYIAWFTSDLPVNVGPWKFNSLPGAILQVYDDSQTYSWTANKIIRNKQDIALTIENTLKKITLQQFVQQDENLKKEKSNRMMLKYVERGAEVVERQYNRGRETKFEWEEETEED